MALIPIGPHSALGHRMPLRPYVLAFAVLLLSSPRSARSSTDTDQFREDTVLCEEALAHLRACCPGSTFSAIACNYFYDDGGCDDEPTTILPSLTTEQSSCFIATSCSALQAQGVCSPTANEGMPTCP